MPFFELPKVELSGPVRQSADGKVAVLDLLAALEVQNPTQALQDLTLEFPEYLRGITKHSFEGAESIPVLPMAGILKLLMVLETPKATQARRWMASTLSKVLEGNVQLAADIVERNPDPEARRWLTARIDNAENRKAFMSKVLEHGGHGAIFQQVSSQSNLSVLGMNSGAFRAYRGVNNTRDGMTRVELARMTYLEGLSSAALSAARARGNTEILELHRKVADWERKLWRHALGHPQEPLSTLELEKPRFQPLELAHASD